MSFGAIASKAMRAMFVFFESVAIARGCKVLGGAKLFECENFASASFIAVLTSDW